MSANSQPGLRPPRLNPFIFPSDTDFRFVLLIVSVLGASLFIYDWLYYSFFGEELRRAILTCRDQASAAYPIDETMAVIDPAAHFDLLTAQTQARGQCLEPLEQFQAAWAFGGLAFFVIVAGAIYWTAPALKIWREKLVRLSPKDAPGVTAYLAHLSRKAALRRPPIFLWNPLNSVSSGLAFGRLGRYYVALSGGLAAQFYSDRPAFQAVVLHELAHLRNADIDKTYFAISIWQTFVITTLVPLGIILINDLLLFRNPGFAFDVVWRIFALAALVYLSRNAVLRAREVYADVQASVWDGPSGALRRIIAALPRPKGGAWAGILRVHPDPDKRRRALDETGQLFRLSFWDAFGTGVAATIAFSTLEFLLFSFAPDQQEGLATLGTALFFAPLAVGVVGAGAWRGAFAALVRGEAPRGAGGLGLGLGLGLILGQILSFVPEFETASALAGVFGLGQADFWVFYILWSVLLLASLFFFLRWIAAGASLWLQVVTTRRSLRLISGLGLTIAGGVLTVWLGSLFSLSNLSLLLFLVDPLGAYIFITGSPLTLLTLMSLWTFPLAAWFWRKRAATASEVNWALLDSSSEPLILPPQPPLRPGLAMIFALAGGLAFCGLLLLIRIGLRLGLSEAVRSTDQYILTFFYGQIALAVLMQVGVAAIVAAWVKQVGWAHGLFAAFVAGCMMVVGILGLNLLFGGTLDAFLAWTVFSLVVNGSAPLVLPAVTGMSAVAGWVR